MRLSINPSLVMMRECPCSTKTREVLGNPSPPPSRFSSAVGFAPLDPRDFPRASPSGNPSGLGVQNPRPRKISRISLDPRDFPRASPSGNLLGLGKLGGGDGFPNTSLVLVEHGYNPNIDGSFLLCGFSCVLIMYQTVQISYHKMDTQKVSLQCESLCVVSKCD